VIFAGLNPRSESTTHATPHERVKFAEGFCDAETNKTNKTKRRGVWLARVALRVLVGKPTDGGMSCTLQQEPPTTPRMDITHLSLIGNDGPGTKQNSQNSQNSSSSN
jgi:hypothetical protein